MILISLLLGAVGGSWTISGLGNTLGLPPWIESALLLASAGLFVLGLSILIGGLFASLKFLLGGTAVRVEPADRDVRDEQESADAREPISAGRAAIWIARLSMTAVATLVFFLLMDWTLGLLLPAYRSALERKFPVENTRKPTPYTMFTGLPGGKIKSGALNDMGYRGPAPSVPKADGEIRIFMLGGSTVFNGEPPISALLQEKFHESGHAEVAVYNFGVLSSVSGMELSRIIHEIADLAPDLILMYNGANDLMHPFFWDPRPGYPFNFIVYENHPLLESNVRTYPTLPLLAYGSTMLRMVGSRYFLDRFVPQAEERRRAGYASEPWREAIVKIYVNNLSKAARVAEAFDSDFLAFFQPMLFFKDELTEEEKALSYEPELGLHCNELREKFRTQVGRLPEEVGSRIVDLSDVYDQYPSRVFVDLAHTTQESKSRMTDVIYRHLMDRSGVWLDGAPGRAPGEVAQNAAR